MNAWEVITIISLIVIVTFTLLGIIESKKRKDLYKELEEAMDFYFKQLEDYHRVKKEYAEY